MEHNERRENLPKWAKEILRFSSVNPQFILFGNIYDIYPFPKGDTYIPKTLNKFLESLFVEKGGYKSVIEFIPLEGFKILEGEKRDINEKSIALKEVYENIEKLVNSDIPTVIILNFSSRLPELSGGDYAGDYEEFMYRLFKLSLEAKPKGNPPLYNIIIFLVEKDNDIPAWYTLENPRVRSIPIPKPDIEIRRWIAKSLVNKFEGWNEIDEKKKKEVIETFVDLTNGMYAKEMLSIIQLSKKEGLSVSEIGEAVRRYRVGITENPWAKIDREKLLNAENIIKKRVIGQDKAVKKAVSILKRAYFNLSGSQYSKHSTRPKGVLFLAGPTGVGKTELAKALTELIFGSETNYIRFDMSEFAHEHSDQRLIGAPPGYVGYDVGGELTNAIKHNPFSVVLFDEIEKAHPKILDIFLQILDEGRLTSGKGEVVYFSESFIIFTSNLGIYEITPTGEKKQRVSPEMPYEDIEKKVKEAIEDFFKYKIARPEILNRIGENIVVFDFIRPEVAYKIAEKMIKNTLDRVWDNFRIKVELTQGVLNKIYAEVSKDLSMGGRGIGNKLEEIFVNPLSTFLFDNMPNEGSKVVIEDLIEERGIWILKGYVE